MDAENNKGKADRQRLSDQPRAVSEATLGSLAGKILAAGSVSRIRRTALQTDNLFEISRGELSMMSTLAVLAGFASHRRHHGRSETIVCW